MFYESVVSALQQASHLVIASVPCNSLKPFWSDELDRLKSQSDSILWHDMWGSAAGKPTSGAVQHMRLSCKAKYKLGLREAYERFEDGLTDEMCKHFASKKFQNSGNPGMLSSERMSVSVLLKIDLLTMLELRTNLLNILAKCSVTLVMTQLLKKALFDCEMSVFKKAYSLTLSVTTV